VEPRLSADGHLTFRNAAVDAGVASAPTHYVVQWSSFDNLTRVHTPVGAPVHAPVPDVEAPASLRDGPEYVAARVHAIHAEYPQWSLPVTLYFVRDQAHWRAVGLERTLPVADAPRRSSR
jgi:hypothetical protein